MYAAWFKAVTLTAVSGAIHTLKKVRSKLITTKKGKQ